MVVTLEEMKQYLRVDFEDDDVILASFISAAEKLCMDVARCEDAEAFAPGEKCEDCGDVCGGVLV